MDEESFDYEYLFRFDPENSGAFKGASRQRQIVMTRSDGRKLTEMQPVEALDEADIPDVLQGLNAAAMVRIDQLEQELAQKENELEQAASLIGKLNDTISKIEAPSDLL